MVAPPVNDAAAAPAAVGASSVKSFTFASGPCANFSLRCTAGGNSGLKSPTKALKRRGRLSRMVVPAKEGYSALACFEAEERAFRKVESPKRSTPERSLAVAT